MTKLDDRIGPRAADIVNRYGKTLSIELMSDAVYNSSLGSATAPSTTIATKGIFAQGRNEYHENEVAGRSRLIYVAATPLNGLMPKAGDIVTVDNRKHVVVVVPEVIYSGEDPALYAIMVKA